LTGVRAIRHNAAIAMPDSGGNPYDTVYDFPDADEIVVIRMTRRQWWHLDDWRAEHEDRYPKRFAERNAALDAIANAVPESEIDDE
jgi:hypothetical protein